MTKKILGSYLVYPNGDAVPTTYVSDINVNASATSSSTAEADLPTGAEVVIIRSTENIWIRFGGAGMGAAAADVNSMLFVAGESIIPTPIVGGVVATKFRVIRAGANDSLVQIGMVPTAPGV